MAWTSPTTRSTGDLITASIYNTDVVDNLIALKDPPTKVWNITGEASDYTTTSGTFSYVDNTADKGQLTITTDGGAVMIGVILSMNGSGRYAIDVEIDGTTDIGGTTAYVYGPSNNLGHIVSFVHVVEGLSAGSHVFRLKWASTNGVSIGIEADGAYGGQFWVREIS